MTQIGSGTRATMRGFTLVEALAVTAILALLGAVLAPVLSAARERARHSACTSALRQVGQAMSLYVGDWDSLLPDRRDLKGTLPGGYRPWSGWPPSDPRAGWSAVVLEPYMRAPALWSCPSVESTSLGHAIAVAQPWPGGVARYWMWRFDRRDEPVPLDNLWGKTEEQAVADLRAANNPVVGSPDSPSDVELATDPYFPRDRFADSPDVRGRSAHFGGRNRLFLDGHVRHLRDGRTQ